MVRLNLLHARGDQRRLLEHARDNYAASGNTNHEVIIRLHAARLAVRRGANDAARDHLLRARELLPDLEERPMVTAGLPMAEVLLAQHDPVGAFELVERVLPANAVDLRVVDELMVWGARAAAALVERASDDRDQTAVQTHREALTRLVKARATLPGIAFQPSGPDDTTQVARAAIFAAESGRAEGVQDQITPWREAVAACAGAGLGWEQQVSSWRLASALIDSGAPVGEAAELLRGVHDYAVKHSAIPLQTRVEELAASTRIPLTSPIIPNAVTVPTAFTGLTPRETQVLAHLVANRTNAEIAQTLLISEKTVSVHVSNLLRKTATGSRREAAALARRVGWTTSS
jgi:DNA-binding CsgD family transcriptional regulator